MTRSLLHGYCSKKAKLRRRPCAIGVRRIVINTFGLYSAMNRASDSLTSDKDFGKPLENQVLGLLQRTTELSPEK